MSETLELAQDKIIEKVGNMCGKFGLNHFVAQLYTVVYLNQQPLSLDELAQRLRVSKSNVCINIRILESWGAVRKIWMKGSRKDFYEADPDIKKIVFGKLRSSVQKRINEVSEMIAEFKDTLQRNNAELSEEEKQTVEIYKERLKRIEELRDLASNAVGFVEKVF